MVEEFFFEEHFGVQKGEEAADAGLGERDEGVIEGESLLDFQENRPLVDFELCRFVRVSLGVFADFCVFVIFQGIR